MRTPLVRAAWWLGAFSLVLSALAGIFFVGFMLTTPGSDAHHTFAQLWLLHDVGAEHNIPSWWASVLWAVLAGCAFALAGLVRRRRASWVTLGGVSTAASVDEYAELHERLDQVGAPMAEALGLGLWFTWVIPGTIIALAVVAVLLPLVWSLPSDARSLIIAGGAVFLLGAVVVETLSGLVVQHFGGQVTWHFILVTLVEETLEMLGVVLAIAGVLRLIQVERTGDGWAVRTRVARDRLDP